MKTDINIFPENMGNHIDIVIGKTSAGKTTHMNAIMEKCVTRMEFGDTTELKFRKSKGKVKNRGKY